MKKLSEFISALWQSILSLVKVALQSQWRVKLPRQSGEIVILANGPSLSQTLADHSDFIKARASLAVSFAARTEQFFAIKPSFYVLTDPMFFTARDEPKFAHLWQILTTGINWKMTLFLPSRFKKRVKDIPGLAGNKWLDVAFYNVTPVEGFKWLENALFRANLGMPRPRNVLIPSIMLTLAMGFDTVYLAGADHSWTRTLSVDDQNRVVSIQPHFYKESEQEKRQGVAQHMRYPLHNMMWNFYVAFKSYFTIARYARHLGVSVFNVTPGSFIDAFPRKKLD